MLAFFVDIIFLLIYSSVDA